MTGEQVLGLVQAQTENLSVQVVVLIAQLVVLLQTQREKVSLDPVLTRCVCEFEKAVSFNENLTNITEPYPLHVIRTACL